MIDDLPKKADLKQFQEYIYKSKEARGFNISDKFMEMHFFNEEVGEMIKAIRKHHYKGTIDHMNCDFKESPREEIVDVFIFLLQLANMHNIDLDKAFREKENYNDIRFAKRMMQFENNEKLEKII